MNRMRISSVVVLSFLLAAASGCGGPPGVSPQLYVSYKPPYVPVSITCHSDGTISLSAETSMVTNFGVFSVGAELPVNSQDDCYYLIIRDHRRPDKGDTVFQIHGAGDSVFVRMDGRSLIGVEKNRTVIDISDGKVRTIDIGPTPSADPGPAEPSEAGAAPAGAVIENALADELTNPYDTRLKVVRPGRFLMGSPTGEAGRFDDEGPQREVEITQSFYLGVHPVTQQEYRNVTGGRNPSWFSETGGGKYAVLNQDTSKFPVEQVSWSDAKAFCDRLNQKDTTKPKGWRYDLPTEAQWEYAARAGMATAYSFGDDPAPLADFAWNFANAGSRTNEVGQRKPNGWGFYDMQGNVSQWCADFYGREYVRGGGKDPEGPETGSRCVVRGGSWLASAVECRSAHRGAHTPNEGDKSIGFRVCLTKDP